MARVSSFFQDDRSTTRPHPTEVEAGWKVLNDAQGQRLFQLSTYGSDDRQSEKKVSQTIQLDALAAQQLVDLLRKTFGL